MSDGIIYFVQGEITKRIKIGFTSGRLHKRLEILQTGSAEQLIPLREILGTQKLEHRLHKEFSEHRVLGEWFHPHESLIYFIQNYVPSDDAWVYLRTS